MGPDHSPSTLAFGVRFLGHSLLQMFGSPSSVLISFLHHFSLLVDIKNHQLRDGLTQLRIQGIAAPDLSPSPSLQSHEPANEFAALLRDFPSVTQPCISERPVQHNVTHHIRTTGPPVSARARRLAPEQLKVAHREFEYMLQLGIVHPSSSCWASPLHMGIPLTYGPQENTR